MFERIDYLESVGSTNDYLKAFVEEGVPRVAIAEEQTAGRGQYGRSWVSEPGKGLYVSYLFFPNWEAERAVLLNAIASLAVLRTIGEYAGGTEPLSLKRPNDVLLGGRKVCGILCELASRGSQISWAIVGIGVNLYQDAFQEELEKSAVSLKMYGIHVPDRFGFYEVLTAKLRQLIRHAEGSQWRSVLQEYDREAR